MRSDRFTLHQHYDMGAMETSSNLRRYSEKSQGVSSRDEEKVRKDGESFGDISISSHWEEQVRFEVFEIIRN